ncbi:MAG: hypothetical protein VW935_19245 [Novosphingobium sp.]
MAAGRKSGRFCVNLYAPAIKAGITDLWLSTRLKREDDGSFTQGEDRISIADEALADAIARAAALHPQRVPLVDITRTADHLRVILQLFAEWYVNRHTAPAPFPAKPAEKPCASPLLRGMLDMGETMLCTLDHGVLKIEQSELRALLRAADGTRTIAQIAALGTGIPAEDTLAALTASCSKALLIA